VCRFEKWIFVLDFYGFSCYPVRGNLLTTFCLREGENFSKPSLTPGGWGWGLLGEIAPLQVLPQQEWVKILSRGNSRGQTFIIVTSMGFRGEIPTTQKSPSSTLEEGETWKLGSTPVQAHSITKIWRLLFYSHPFTATSNVKSFWLVDGPATSPTYGRCLLVLLRIRSAHLGIFWFLKEFSR